MESLTWIWSSLFTAVLSPSICCGRRCGRRASGWTVLQKCNLDAHLGQDARVLLPETDPHPHCRLFAIGGRHDGDNIRRNGPIAIGVEYRGDRSVGKDTADELFVDVDFD